MRFNNHLEKPTLRTNVITTVIISIVANPLTVPVPQIYIINAASSVVNCASKIAPKDNLPPSATAARTLLPLYNS